MGIFGEAFRAIAAQAKAGTRENLRGPTLSLEKSLCAVSEGWFPVTEAHSAWHADVLGAGQWTHAEVSTGFKTCLAK